MSRVDLFKDALEQPTVYFVRYTRERTKNRLAPIFIFEGIDDPKYYTVRIAYRFGTQWIPISVEGKDNVLELRSTIRNNKTYSDDHVSFFIDKDFDEKSIDFDDVYQTPCYAIENFYLSVGSIRHLILSLGEFSKQSDEESNLIDFVMEKYEQHYRNFINHKDVKLANLLFLYIRKVLMNKRISLDSILSIKHEFISSYLLTVELKGKGLELKDSFDAKDFFRYVRRNPIARRILKGDASCYRGKQLIAFLREFVSSIRSDKSVINLQLKSTTGLCIRFKNNNIGGDLLADLSGFAETPPCLTVFLDSRHETFSKKIPAIN